MKSILLPVYCFVLLLNQQIFAGETFRSLENEVQTLLSASVRSIVTVQVLSHKKYRQKTMVDFFPFLPVILKKSLYFMRTSVPALSSMQKVTFLPGAALYSALNRSMSQCQTAGGKRRIWLPMTSKVVSRWSKSR